MKIRMLVVVSVLALVATAVFATPGPQQKPPDLTIIQNIPPGQQAPARIGGNIKSPTRIKDVKPAYPPEAQKAGIQGVVIVEVVIGPDGKVKDVKVLRSIPMLDQAAIDAVKQWEFVPTLLNGVPISVLMTATVNFTLGGQPSTEIEPVSRGQVPEAPQGRMGGRGMGGGRGFGFISPDGVCHLQLPPNSVLIGQPQIIPDFGSAPRGYITVRRVKRIEVYRFACAAGRATLQLVMTMTSNPTVIPVGR